jgi:hypothetical protein
VTAPALLIHGLKDGIVPKTFSEELYHNCGSAKKQLVLPPQMTHNAFSWPYVLSVVQRFIADVEVGTAIGSLPKFHLHISQKHYQLMQEDETPTCAPFMTRRQTATSLHTTNSTSQRGDSGAPSSSSGDLQVDWSHPLTYPAYPLLPIYFLCKGLYLAVKGTLAFSIGAPLAMALPEEDQDDGHSIASLAEIPVLCLYCQEQRQHVGCDGHDASLYRSTSSSSTAYTVRDSTASSLLFQSCTCGGGVEPFAASSSSSLERSEGSATLCGSGSFLGSSDPRHTHAPHHHPAEAAKVRFLTSAGRLGPLVENHFACVPRDGLPSVITFLPSFLPSVMTFLPSFRYNLPSFLPL